MSKVDCTDFRHYLDPYLDGEFDHRERAEFDAHLAICAECRQFSEQSTWIQNAARSQLQRPERMSDTARARITGELRAVQRPERRRRALKGVVKGVVPALVAASAIFLFVSPLTGFVPVDDAISHHTTTSPLEMPTSEYAEARDWFSHKVSFNVNIPRLKDAALLGARLSRVSARKGTRNAAYLVYGKGARKVTVLVFDADGYEFPEGQAVKGKPVSLHHRNGTTVAFYREGSVGYAVTANLSDNDMLRLIRPAL